MLPCVSVPSRRVYSNKLSLLSFILFSFLHFVTFLFFQAARESEAEKTHYLISTHQIPGVYYSPFTGPSPKELELRDVRPLTPKTRGILSARLRTAKFETFDDRESVSPQESKKYKLLPPINADKVQVCNISSTTFFV